MAPRPEQNNDDTVGETITNVPGGLKPDEEVRLNGGDQPPNSSVRGTMKTLNLHYI